VLADPYEDKESKAPRLKQLLDNVSAARNLR
jgi:hypothetical protein